MSRLTRDGTAEPVSRDQILRREREQGSIHFPCSADHEQDWQPYPVDPYSCYMYDHTYRAIPVGNGIVSKSSIGRDKSIEKKSWCAGNLEGRKRWIKVTVITTRSVALEGSASNNQTPQNIWRRHQIHSVQQYPHQIQGFSKHHRPFLCRLLFSFR